ncbi:hypothetical protein CEXT_470771 [Caerostris extrusa]|uniref:Uncharacterized protein n=1 Tax=Caerostris extrusa TaxID=172846 RepID=A0AAV4WXH6_CAEEX|nr:hypothetical protein CEXT_470771 [Caerostris extrusa]
MTHNIILHYYGTKSNPDLSFVKDRRFANESHFGSSFEISQVSSDKELQEWSKTGSESEWSEESKSTDSEMEELEKEIQELKSVYKFRKSTRNPRIMYCRQRGHTGCT